MTNPTSLTNLKKGNLEACWVVSCGRGVGSASGLLTSVLRASAVIDHRPLLAQLPRTSPWRLQQFASSTINLVGLHLVHQYLITRAQLSDLIPVFEVGDSSTRETSQIFLGGRVWRIWAPCCFTERERERKREHTVLGAWFCFFGRTLTDRKIERREKRSGEYSAKLLAILECINREHRRCRAFITFVIKDKLLVLQLTTLSRLAMELHPQPALTTRPQGRTMAEIHRWWCSRFKGWVVLRGCTQISSIRICRRKSTGINRMNIGPKWEVWELRVLLLWVYHPYYWSAVLLLIDKKVHGPMANSLVSRSVVHCSFENTTNYRLRASFN